MEHNECLIQYLSVLKEINKDTLITDRIHNTCDEIEKQLGIKTPKYQLDDVGCMTLIEE